MDMLTIWELKKERIEDVLKTSERLKREHKKGVQSKALQNKTLAMLFEKASTRTRVSFEAAMTQLGGHAIYIDLATSQISRGETMDDTGKVLGGYVDGIMARLYKHSDMEELAKGSAVPVINGLDDLEHPCQALGDLLTMKEWGKFGKGKKLAFVGDCGFNVCNSVMLACSKVGMDVSLVCPKGYPPNGKYVKEAQRYADVTVEHDPLRGVDGADVIYTDVWVSMGQEKEKEERLKAFGPFQVNKKMVGKANKGCIAMHCLPAHRGFEITSDVLDGPQSAVWDEAENRLHIQKGILAYLMKG
jgi:ornithine carbamoyltransferase